MRMVRLNAAFECQIACARPHLGTKHLVVFAQLANVGSQLALEFFQKPEGDRAVDVAVEKCKAEHELFETPDHILTRDWLPQPVTEGARACLGYGKFLSLPGALVFRRGGYPATRLHPAECGID